MKVLLVKRSGTLSIIKCGCEDGGPAQGKGREILVLQMCWWGSRVCQREVSEEKGELPWASRAFSPLKSLGWHLSALWLGSPWRSPRAGRDLRPCKSAVSGLLFTCTCSWNALLASEDVPDTAGKDTLKSPQGRAEAVGTSSGKDWTPLSKLGSLTVAGELERDTYRGPSNPDHSGIPWLKCHVAKLEICKTFLKTNAHVKSPHICEN